MTTDEDHPELVQTQALADGELRGEELVLAQEHLATCTRCQAELADLMQLEAMPMPRPTNVVSLAWYRRKSVQVASVAVFAAAAIAVLYVGKKPAAVVDHHDAPKVALAEKRALEARVSWAGASDYRAYSVPRGQMLAKEPISLAAMADLEKAGDLHGVGALALLGGDLEQAKKYLALAGDNPGVMADHAALELSLGQPAAALMLADAALEKKPDDPVATWNRALALRDLGLNQGAAKAFRAVAQHAEKGWSAEAAQRADALEKADIEEIQVESRLNHSSASLMEMPGGVSLDDARRMPGLARVMLYDALRAAPTADAVAKLKALADAVDAGDRGASASDAFARHHLDPVAATAYAALLDPRSNAEQQLGILRARKANDALVVGFLKRSDDGLVPDKDLPELVRLASASPDPWIQLIGIEQRGAKALNKKDLGGAEAALITAKPLCDAGAPSYRCMKIGILLGRTYLEWQRLPEARAILLDAFSRSRSISSIWQQDELISLLTEVSILADDTVGGGLPLVRAYAEEYEARMKAQFKADRREEPCAEVRWAHARIATELMIQLRVSDAAAEIASAPACKSLTTNQLALEIFVRSEILHLNSTASQLTAFRKDAEDARTRPDLVPGDRALIDHAEGRALVGSDPVEGERLMRRAIEDTAKDPASVNGQRAVGFTYATLAVLAAKRGDVEASFAVLAEEMKIVPRANCVLGIALDDRDVVVVARDTTGQPIVGNLERTTLELDSSKIVPGRVIDALRGCEDVDVIARPPFHGTARLLPDNMAWRYVTRTTRSSDENRGTSVIVDDVQPPPSLNLPRLSSFPTSDAVVLRGAAATPTRVLAAMSGPRDLLINAHGLADRGDASYLALSPDSDGRYALTAADVSRAKLTSHPLVILAACEAAKAAPVFHARWSLPTAFVTAGARAVVASTSAIPDADAAAFFGELRSRALAGQPLATVLRDLRQKWLVTPNTNFWVRDVVVFE